MKLAFALLPLFLILKASPASAAAQRTCSADSIASCEQLAAAPLDASGNRALGIPSSQTGAVTFNAYGYLKIYNNTAGIGSAEVQAPDISAFARPSPAQIRNGLSLADEIRKEAIAMILGDTRRDLLTAEQTALVQRLETIRIRVAADDDEMCNVNVPTGFPNGSYEGLTHSLDICPATMKQSPAYMAYLLGHEIGHVVSPCLSNWTLYQVNLEKANRSEVAKCDSSLVLNESEGNEGMNAYGASFTEKLITSRATHTVGDPKSDELSLLTRCGIISPATRANPQVAIFAAPMQCIVNASRSTYNARYAYDIQALATATGRPPAQAASDIETQAPRACFGTALEQFADGFSAQIFGRIAIKKAWSAADIKAGLLIPRGNICSEQALAGRSRDPAEYPTAMTRLNTALNNPDLAARLGCAPAASADLCPVNVGQARVSAPARQTPASSNTSRTRSAH